MMTDTTTDPHLGRVVAGYRIEELIGRGGMGLVYRAEHLNLARRAAIKLIAPDLAEAAGFRERFNREARIAAALQHPNIVTVYDAGEDDGLLYLAMQHIEGSDLAAFLRTQGRLRPYRALDVCRQVAAALDAAHAQGLIHRDVKPANVLIEGRTAFLTDFGLTKRIDGSRTQLTRAGDVVGTIHYVAPEQIEGGRVDARSDIYSLGCLVYHVLSGELPFARDTDVAVIYAHLSEEPPRLTSVRPDLPARARRGDRQGAREGAGAAVPDLRGPHLGRPLGDRRRRPAVRHRHAAARPGVRRCHRRPDLHRRAPRPRDRRPQLGRHRASAPSAGTSRRRGARGSCSPGSTATRARSRASPSGRGSTSRTPPRTSPCWRACATGARTS